jgi:predicted ATPase
MFHQYRREGETAKERAEATIALASEQGFPHWLAIGTFVQGWALAEQGQQKKGVAQMRQGLAAYRTTSELYRPHLLGLLAEEYGKVGQPEEGLTVLAEALAIVDKTGERYYEAELYRLRGELTLQEANQKAKGKNQKAKIETSLQHLTPSTQAEAEAEGYFLKAIEISRKQQAKSLELRAVMSLSRLWQQQGKQKEAHDMLAEVYNWFTEGLDTKDLQEAKAILEELAS